MNDKTRQLLILFALLVFLSMITIFQVRMNKSETHKVNENGSARNFSGVTLEKREGNDLITQSINGLIDLYRDIRTGIGFLYSPS